MRGIAIFLALAGLSSAACSKSDPPSCGERRCSAGVPVNAPKGLDGDGGVAVTAKEAWPDRGMEFKPTAQQLADACALIFACRFGDDGMPLDDVSRATLTRDCARGADPSNAKEERAVMQAGLNERFYWEVQRVLALASPTCADVRALETKRSDLLTCQEDGCWWESPVPAAPACCAPIPKVTCAGDVATLTSEGSAPMVRDCTRAFAKCDTRSSTGCTDRAPLRCDPAATDICDGDVKLGCDGEGRVSFHDCALYPGGKCVADAMGVRCERNDNGCSGTKLGCTGDKLAVCVSGAPVTVDCKAVFGGAGSCKSDHCAGP